LVPPSALPVDEPLPDVDEPVVDEPVVDDPEEPEPLEPEPEVEPVAEPLDASGLGDDPLSSPLQATRTAPRIPIPAANPQLIEALQEIVLDMAFLSTEPYVVDNGAEG